MSAPLMFGPHHISENEVFFNSSKSFGLVNLKPIVPGHVLVLPNRVVARFADLEQDEVADLWIAAQTIGRQLEKHYNAQSMTFAIQDGPASGQTVPHVHIHILPRHFGDYSNNDEVYTDLESFDPYGEATSKSKPAEQKPRALDLDPPTGRAPRTAEAMAAEASELRALFS
eukprot:GILJ01007423.1.p1 GENE.GILJ01007423.1~~GILJ01007423.1.p1  ORF type:complete len:193 (-),score=25.04 GILJ01007423.1:252-764(-)